MKSRNVNSRDGSLGTTEVTNKVVAAITWILMVMSPMMLPATETLRVAERLR